MRSPRTERHARSLAALAFALAGLAACGPTYKFTPPTSQIGQVCTMQCQTSADQCRSLKQQEYEQCQWRQQMAQSAYNDCVAAKGAMACSGPTGMCYMPNTYECDLRYRSCYEACGGTVTEVKDPS